MRAFQHVFQESDNAKKIRSLYFCRHDTLLTKKIWLNWPYVSRSDYVFPQHFSRKFAYFQPFCINTTNMRKHFLLVSARMQSHTQSSSVSTGSDSGALGTRLARMIFRDVFRLDYHSTLFSCARDQI